MKRAPGGLDKTTDWGDPGRCFRAKIQMHTVTVRGYVEWTSCFDETRTGSDMSKALSVIAAEVGRGDLQQVLDVRVRAISHDPAFRDHQPWPFCTHFLEKRVITAQYRVVIGFQL
jgi:hypothetical protein